VLHRLAGKVLKTRLREFPAVALVGPRQCGKTTLARGLAPEPRYFDLEQPSARLRLDLEWEAVADGRALAVLDEAQEWPEVFARLRGAIDSDRRRNGRFLLLGSVSPALMRQVGESLAGRLALVELTPFVLPEVRPRRADTLWRSGGFPDGGVLGTGRYPVWQQSYLQLMAQRDLPNWGLPSKPSITERLFKMTAALQGSVLNASKLGQSLGLSYHTVQSYLSFLEGAYLLRLLPPFEANLGKRLVKSPRLYWRDSGLLHALLGLAPNADLLPQPWVGASWEGWVIEQIIATRQSRGEALSPFFFRSHDGHEVDLVLEGGGERELIEIKLTSTPAPDDLARLDRLAGSLGGTRQVLISRTRTPVVAGTRWSVDLETYLRRA
jgi:hypothetical protein